MPVIPIPASAFTAAATAAISAKTHPYPPVMEYPEDDDEPTNPFAFSYVIYLLVALVLAVTFFLVYYVIYTYLIRSAPYYYTIPDPNNRHARILRRVVPLREYIRQLMTRPRSDSDEFRQRDFERVSAILQATGWKGHVYSDGTPDVNSSHLGFDGEEQEEGDIEAYRNARRAAWVERPDTSFWREQAKLHPRDRLFSSPQPQQQQQTQLLPHLNTNVVTTTTTTTTPPHLNYNTFDNTAITAASTDPSAVGPSSTGFFRSDADIPDAGISRFHRRDDSAIGSFGDEDDDDYSTEGSGGEEEEDDEEERERQNQIFNYYQTYAAAMSYHPSPTEVMKTPFSHREYGDQNE